MEPTAIDEPTLDAAPQTRPDVAVRCRACGHGVTQHHRAIDVNGAHHHTFRNPAGYSFHLVCFSDAPGALRVGAATPEATWFAGYAWRFAICAECHTHLGWWYESGPDDTFAGLIATRLQGVT